MTTANIIEFEPRKPKFEEGSHRAKTIDIERQDNCMTSFGVRTKVVVTCEVEKPTPTGIEMVLHKEYYLASKFPESKFAKMVFGITGQRVSKYFDLNSLLGVDVVIEIKHHVNEDGDTYDNVESVWLQVMDLAQGQI